VFTGIIEEVGSIGTIERSFNSISLQIKCQKILEGMAAGDSICVSGICLTVKSLDGGSFWADATPETLQRTSIADMAFGTRVNLERALTLSSRLGGHLVTGHVDGVGRLVSVTQVGNSKMIRIEFDAELRPFIAPKGSVALEGISLTVVSVVDNCFEVSVIPFTENNTNLRYKRVGDKLNIETDIIAKYIKELVSSNQQDRKSRLLDLLRNKGFLGG
jgi:riboflavin synthase